MRPADNGRESMKFVIWDYPSSSAAFLSRSCFPRNEVDHHGFWGFCARGRAELFPPEACYALDSAVYIQATADAPAYAVNPEDAPEYGL